jgi:hypothetical protein
MLTGCLAFTPSKYPWVTASNFFSNGIVVNAYVGNRSNRGSLILPQWPLSFVTLDVFSFTARNPPFSDMKIAVILNNSLSGFLTANSFGNINRTFYTFNNINPGSKVELLMPWDTVDGAQGTGVDTQKEGTAFFGLWAPSTYVPKAQRFATGTIGWGDSIFSAVLPNAANSIESMGPGGQYRLLGNLLGWGTANLDYGGATEAGDGITPAQRAQVTIDMADQMGLTTAKVIWRLGRNDYANGTATPTTVANGIQSSINLLPGPRFKHLVVTPIPQASEVAVAGFTLPQFRTPQLAITGAVVIDGPTTNIVPGTDLADGVHENTLGVTKDVNTTWPAILAL